MEEKNQLAKASKEKLQQGKHGLLRLVFGRTAIVVLLLLVQIGILLIGFALIRDYLFATYWATVLLAMCLVVVIINRKGNPAFQIAWIVPILVVPVFGSLLYLYVYSQFGARRLNQKIREEVAGTSSIVAQKKATFEALQSDSPQMAHLVSYLQKMGGSVAHDNTSAHYFTCGEKLIEPLLEDLRSARRFIFLEYFIVTPGYMWDSVLEILKAKAKEGVEVRFLYDGMCGFFHFPKDYPKELETYGIHCRIFAPIVPALSTVQNNRDHRKILVIDGHTAYTGGINLADEYINRKVKYGYWKDSAIRIQGEAVASFTLMFLQIWNVTGQSKTRESYRQFVDVPLPKDLPKGSGFVIPFDDNPLDGEQVAESVYMDILYSAKHYVHITTPYLVLDHEMIVALTYAAKRGVDVKILMPHIPDKKYAFMLARTYYNELLDGGVQIFEFEPGFVHTKSIVSDGEKAVVGSINMDYRSFYLSFECAVLLYKNSEIQEIEKDFQQTLRKCIPVTEETFAREPFYERLAGKVLRLFAPLL